MALKWARQAEEKYDMECTYEEGEEQDTLCFSRAGVKGTLDVRSDAIDFRAQLGFLVSAFKERIQAELEQQFDSLLAASPENAGPAEGARPASSSELSVEPAAPSAARAPSKSPVSSDAKKKRAGTKASRKALAQPQVPAPGTDAQLRPASASRKPRPSDIP